MRRGLIALDRFAALIIGLVLVAAGAAALGWRFDLITKDRLELSGLTDIPQQGWWPWATGVGGVLLVFIGFSWLVRHLPRRGTGQLRLTGSDETGRLTADANAAASTAGKVLARTPGVRSGSGRVILDRGQLVAVLSATLEPGAEVDVVRAAAEQTGEELHRVIGRDDLHHRIELRVARDPETPARRVL
jgi:flagellar biosynthesis/type III secretory pathway M-ring protein FliF/YscJ